MDDGRWTMDDGRGMRLVRLSSFRLFVLSVFLLLLTASHGVLAVELWSDEQGRRGELAVAGKTTFLASDAPSDPVLLQRARWLSGSTGLGAGSSFLPSEALAPFRLAQLDWEIAADDSFSYRHEIDRGLVALHPEWGDVAVGRQAIGLGRGVLFGAVDVFNPFSPLEVDREWRRGVDAFRAEYRLSTTSSADCIAAFGESWEQSALLGRLRGYLGDVDGSLIFGKRSEDFMVGSAFSAAVGDAEVHGEYA